MRKELSKERLGKDNFENLNWLIHLISIVFIFSQSRRSICENPHDLREILFLYTGFTLTFKLTC